MKKKAIEGKKSKRIIKWLIISLLLIILLSSTSYGLYLLLRPKFKDYTIELGTTKVSVKDFLVSNMYKKNSSFVTNMKDIEIDKVGTYNIVLKHNKKEETVHLTVEDTTPPKVEFQDVVEYTGYEIDPNDFVLSKEDLSDMKVSYEVKDPIDTTIYDDYTITIIVTDAYNNKVKEERTLHLGWLRSAITIEAGEKELKKQMVVNIEQDVKKISDADIKNVDIYTPGEYEVVIKYEEEDYKSIITVVDTTPPVLELKDVRVFEDQILSTKDFIKKVSDNSKKYETNCLTDLNTSKHGTYTVSIEAKDSSGNNVVQEAKLTVKQDKTPPTIKGLSNMEIKKNSDNDYKKGVTATDNVDGNIDFDVDISSLDLTQPGTYYIAYKATDKKGNTTSKKRTVLVLHDSSDTSRVAAEFADTIPNDIPEIVNEVRNRIKYSNNWYESDPVWYGITEKRGNCFVHAKVLEAVLNKKGITNKLIWNREKTHYWNLIHINGVWRHVDSTPGNNYILLTDEEMQSKKPVISGGGFEPGIWPEAI